MKNGRTIPRMCSWQIKLMCSVGIMKTLAVKSQEQVLISTQSETGYSLHVWPSHGIMFPRYMLSKEGQDGHVFRAETRKPAIC